jgi:hypothetical protein
VTFILSVVIVADGVQAEGEYTDIQQTVSVQEPLQTASPELPQTPTTPPSQSQPLLTPPATKPTRVRLPPGYYVALHEGETASIALDSLKEASAMDLMEEEAHIHLALAVVEPESTLQQALNGPASAEWQEALNYEISQLEKLGTWEIVDLPHSTNLIPCHFVLATKQGLDSEKLKLCARLVANGQRQKFRVDYFDTFAATANRSMICMVLAMAAQ